MSNWDFIEPYDQDAACWLRAQSLPHPSPRSGNRLPTTKETVAAWKLFDSDQSLLIDNFAWDNDAYVPDGHFKMKGNLLVALRVLVKLSQDCGQLWMYPDTGEPAIVVDSKLDPVRTHELYVESVAAENSWEHFHRKMYSADSH